MWRRLKKVSIPVQIFALVLFLLFGIKQLRHSTMAFLNLQGVGAFINTRFFDAGPMLSHTWFVSVIIICYLLTPYLGQLIQKNILSKYTLGVLWLVTFLVPFMGFNMCFVTLYITSSYVAAAKGINIQISKKLLLFVMVLAIAGRIGGKIMFDDTVLYDKVIVYITHFTLATSIILFIRELYRSEKVSDLCDNKIFKFIDNDSYYIYIVHYCLIPPTYEYFGIAVATLIFFILTICFSIALRVAHQTVLRILP